MAIFAFWLFASRTHHPTLLIGALATAVLVAVAAVAVYINRFMLLPKYKAHPHTVMYLLLLLLTVVALSLVAVMSIGWVYDVLWGPDPLRYGFWRNLVYEAIFITVHVMIAMAVVGVMRRMAQAKVRLGKAEKEQI